MIYTALYILLHRFEFKQGLAIWALIFEGAIAERVSRFSLISVCQVE